MGSSSKTTSQVPRYIEQGGMEAIERARKIADMGYVPYAGPDVAMPSPATLSAWQGQDQASAAFGMPFASATGLEGLPVANAGGIQGYSSFPGYAASLERLAEQYPGLYAYLSAMTIDPVTGEGGANMVGPGGGGRFPQLPPHLQQFPFLEGLGGGGVIGGGGGGREEHTSPTGGGGFDRVNDVFDRADRAIDGLLGR